MRITRDTILGSSSSRVVHLPLVGKRIYCTFLLYGRPKLCVICLVICPPRSWEFSKEKLQDFAGFAALVIFPKREGQISCKWHKLAFFLASACFTGRNSIIYINQVHNAVMGNTRMSHVCALSTIVHMHDAFDAILLRQFQRVCQTSRTTPLRKSKSIPWVIGPSPGSPTSLRYTFV